MYLYVGGGRDGTGTVLDTVEWINLAQIDEHDHEVGTDTDFDGAIDVPGVWTPDFNLLPGPRWKCQAFVADPTLHPLVQPGDTWVLFGGGDDGAGGIEDQFDGRLVGAGGGFSTLMATVSDMKGYSGYVAAAASNYLYTLGADTPGGQGSGESAPFCNPADGACQGDGPPRIRGFNALGSATLIIDRHLAGSAQESSVIFAVGGDDGSGALTSTEYTNY
jgi:hypothetical protein